MPPNKVFADFTREVVTVDSCAGLIGKDQIFS